MPYTYTIEIDAPIEKVFDCVDDPEKLKLWMTGLEETTYLSEFNPHNPVGVRFKQKIREGGRVTEYDGEVTGYKRPEYLAVRIFGKQFSVQVDYRFTAWGNRTQLDYSADITTDSWLIRIMLVLVGWFNKLILRKQMKKLKALAEQDEMAPR